MKMFETYLNKLLSIVNKIKLLGNDFAYGIVEKKNSMKNES